MEFESEYNIQDIDRAIKYALEDHDKIFTFDSLTPEQKKELEGAGITDISIRQHIEGGQVVGNIVAIKYGKGEAHAISFEVKNGRDGDAGRAAHFYMLESPEQLSRDDIKQKTSFQISGDIPIDLSENDLIGVEVYDTTSKDYGLVIGSFVRLMIVGGGNMSITLSNTVYLGNGIIGKDGKDFKFDDFTQEQLELLKKPASDAAKEVKTTLEGVNTALTQVQQQSTNAESSAASANQTLNTIQQEIQQMVEDPDTDAAIVAKVANNTANISALEQEINPSTEVELSELIRGAYTTTNLTWSAHKNTDDGQYASGYIISVNEGEVYRIKADSANACTYTFLTSDDVLIGGNVSVVEGTGRNQIDAGNESEIEIPEGCRYLQFNGKYNSNIYTPEYVKKVKKRFKEIENQLVPTIKVLEEIEKEQEQIKEDCNLIKYKVSGFDADIDLNELIKYELSINSSGNWSTYTVNVYHFAIEVKEGMIFKIKANDTFTTRYAWLESHDTSSNRPIEGPGNPAPLIKGEQRVVIPIGDEQTIIVPAAANYLYIEYSGGTKATGANITCPEKVIQYKRVTDITDALNERVDDLSKCIGFGTDIISLNGKDWLDEMFASAKKPVRVSGELLQNPLTLIHFSDIHGDGDNLSRIVELTKTHSVDDIIHCGDTVASYVTQGIGFWANTNGAERILNCIGNHDVRDIDGSTWKEDTNVRTEQATFDMFFSPFISNWGVVNTSGKCYYYKDYENHNATIRLIVLDIMHNTDEQIVWFRNVLEEATNNSYHVVVAKHTFNGGELPIKCTFNGVTRKDARNRYNSTKWTYQDSLDCQPIVQEYIDRGLNFVCYLVGHTHYDCVAVHPDYPKQIAISISSANAKTIESTDYKRTIGKRSQDLFNVVTIEPYYKMIKVFRVGANHDIYCRRVESMVIDYGEGKVEYSA